MLGRRRGLPVIDRAADRRPARAWRRRRRRPRSPTTSGEAVSGEPELTFGFIGPGVGLLNELAIGQDRGLQLAIDDINAAGGVLGAPVAAVRVDEAAPDPIDGVVDQLVEQGADVLVGPVGSSSTVDLLPILERTSAAGLLGVGDGDVADGRRPRRPRSSAPRCATTTWPASSPTR